MAYELTICGISELPDQSARGVTHVLSLVDPDCAPLEAFAAYGPHRRKEMRFHDILGSADGMTHPVVRHVEDVLTFGDSLKDDMPEAGGHLLVHCHMGVSRSTAAMMTLMAQADPQAEAEDLFLRLAAIRPQAWPNSHMIGFADALLGRKGELVAGLRRHYGRQLLKQPQYKSWMADLNRHSELAMAL